MNLSRPLIWQDKRFILTVLMALVVGSIFWFGSRYPALNRKALMGGESSLPGLGFDVLVEVPPDAPMLERILYTTINWCYTNKQGMTFGVLFAAVLMTLVPLLKTRNIQNRYLHSALGMIIGSPLGVCVNCATPIAQGLMSAGGRVETALAAMMSSPTLNVIVLTMLFAFFPFHLALIKIGLTVLFILVGIPLIIRLLPISANLNKQQAQTLLQDTTFATAGAEMAGTMSLERWPAAVNWVVRNFIKNLWFIIKTTVPLMLLAGLLGSAMVVILPFESLVSLIPRAGHLGTLAMMGGVALVGLFLPAPMTFDVIITSSLLQAGLPMKYGATMLFTLGIFSIYPFLLIWKTLSRTGALVIFVVLLGLGVVSGALAHEADQWHQARQQRLLLETFTEMEGMDHPILPPRTVVSGEAAADLVAALQQQALQPELVSQTEGLTVERLPFQAQSRRSEAPFYKMLGSDFGLIEGDDYSILAYLAPFSYLRGIAAGDVHQDGWTDILVVSKSGFTLYANQQGQGYVPQAVDMPDLGDGLVASASLVDLNDDGWLDIFFTTYKAGSHVIYNQNGLFSLDNWQVISDKAEAATTAAAFGDVDNDGDLDIALGNMDGSSYVRNIGGVPGGSYAPETVQNYFLLNEGGRWAASPLPEIHGETMSTLFTDLNQDGQLDLVVGNDLKSPDHYYLGDGQGQFRLVTRADGLIPQTTGTTMGATTADINNDLTPELYLNAISKPYHGNRKQIPAQELCQEIEAANQQQRCIAEAQVRDVVVKSRLTKDATACLSLTGEGRLDCLAMQLYWTSAGWTPDQDNCDLFPAGFEYLAAECHLRFMPHDAPTTIKEETAIPIERAENILLSRDQTGQFVNRASELGLGLSGWVWNAKFADLDQDEWQDLYAVNGAYENSERHRNNLFQNQQGTHFVEKADELGLGSWIDTMAYTYTDLDNDGDLDIITVPAVGPLFVYLNQWADGQAIAFELRDHRGNRFGIGSKVIIHYGDGHHQMREMMASGGYMSFDAPVAHFGLGDYDRVNRVEVLWSTGEWSELSGEFMAGARYIITRSE